MPQNPIVCVWSMKRVFSIGYVFETGSGPILFPMCRVSSGTSSVFFFLTADSILGVKYYQSRSKFRFGLFLRSNQHFQPFFHQSYPLGVFQMSENYPILFGCRKTFTFINSKFCVHWTSVEHSFLPSAAQRVTNIKFLTNFIYSAENTSVLLLFYFKPCLL